MSQAELIQIIITAMSGVLIPIALLVVGNWYTRQKEKTDEAQHNADRIALLLKHLASENISERLLALQVLQYLRIKKEFPAELANTVTAITFRDTPDVAGAALLAMGGSGEIPDEVILLELLAPLKVQLDRTREAIRTWKARDEHTERFIKQSNEYTRDLLISRAYLIPKELQEAANQLVTHYNNWLKKYDSVYKDGVRDPQVAFIYTRDFPPEAEQKFLAKFEALRSKTLEKP